MEEDLPYVMTRCHSAWALPSLKGPWTASTPQTLDESSGTAGWHAATKAACWALPCTTGSPIMCASMLLLACAAAVSWAQ